MLFHNRLFLLINQRQVYQKIKKRIGLILQENQFSVFLLQHFTFNLMCYLHNVFVINCEMYLTFLSDIYIYFILDVIEFILYTKATQIIYPSFPQTIMLFLSS